MPGHLEDFLARVYDRTQRVFPQGRHRVILRWLLQEDVVDISDASETKAIPYPAYWAESEETCDPAININWNEGEWAEE